MLVGACYSWVIYQLSSAVKDSAVYKNKPPLSRVSQISFGLLAPSRHGPKHSCRMAVVVWLVTILGTTVVMSHVIKVASNTMVKACIRLGALYQHKPYRLKINVGLQEC